MPKVSLHLFPTSRESLYPSLFMLSWGLASGLFLVLFFRPMGGLEMGAAVLMSLVVAPVVEELFFRGVVHEALLRSGMNAVAAMVLVSGLFALAHLWHSSPGHALATAVPALVIGAVFHQIRHHKGLIAAVIAAMLLHSLFNAIWRLGLAEQMLNYVPWLV